MFIVGLTGGIGSGKTTVAAMFKAHNVPVYIADVAAKEILATNLSVQQQVKSLLGNEAFINHGTHEKPDTAHIASIVFKNRELLDKLNGIIHPAVRAHFNHWLSQQDARYVIYEAAILLETGGNLICDYVIVVTAPLHTRIARVVARDGSTKEQVLERLKNQWSDKQRLDYAHFILINENLGVTRLQVSRIHTILSK